MVVVLVWWCGGGFCRVSHSSIVDVFELLSSTCLFCLFVIVCFVLFCLFRCRYANAAKNIQNTAIVNRSPHEIAMLRKTLQLNAMTFEYVSCWVWLFVESGCLLKVVVCWQWLFVVVFVVVVVF